MSEVIIQQPEMLWLLPLVAVFIVVFRVRMARRKQDMQAFGEDAAWRGSEHRSMELWRLVLLVVAVVLIILALTRPAVNPHPRMLQREGRDVVFLLDVSKSMLAEDRLPNRLQSAKMAIADCVKDLQDHRLGLVVFAGSSSIACPLTVDKEFFLNSLDKAGPDSVAHGGTRVGDALLKVCDKLFSDSDQGYKDIVLLTDGGDHGESLTKAMELVNEKQVKLIAIGLGDEKKGARIPQVGAKSDYMLYKDQEVWSRLDTLQLSHMVKQAHQGAFLAVGTRQMKLGDIYKRISEQEKKQQLAEESVVVYDEVFQIFIGLALILLAAMVMVPHTLTRRLKKSAVATAMLMFGLIQTVDSAQVDVADQAFEAGQFQQALEIYEVLAEKSEDARVWYKKGNSQYRLARYEEAVLSYEDALKRQPEGWLIRDITYNLGNAYFHQSKNAEDLYTALSLMNQSVTMFRRVILQNPDDRDAAVNMELAKIERRGLQKQIAEDEKRRKEMKDALAKLKESIELLIAGQARNLKDTDDCLMMPVPEPSRLRSLLDKEQSLKQSTAVAIELTSATNQKFFKDLPPEVSPLGETMAQLGKALDDEATAIEYMLHHPHDAYVQEDLALTALRAALEALPRDPDSADDQEGEGEEGDEEGESEEGEGDEEGDEGDQESDADGEGTDSEATEASKMNLESIDLPPPNDSPEDVIKKNAVMQEARKSEGGKKKGKPVEKDW
ncbi:MAG: VWA domain-containing protein [Akkermansiaceae bacterium]|nr:VWA domain-containing protein [Akkermansiaceae bacterium]